MKAFADLFTRLDQTNKTNEKVAILKDYFQVAPPESKIWTLALLSGRRPKRQVNTTLMRKWAAESAGIPLWLFEESYHVVGDLAETVALLLPPPRHPSDFPLHEWMQMLQSLGKCSEDEKKEALLNAWGSLDEQERLVFNKLITGSFRIGVSQNLVVRALAELTGTDPAALAHRLMGNWTPEKQDYDSLLFDENISDDLSKPYPFFLAHAVQEPESLGNPNEWTAEWKWDGIRAQIIQRQDEIFIWSRGEDLVTEKFPELKPLCKSLPSGTVLDGELLPFADGRPLPFSVLQTRLGRKTVSAKLMKEAPVIFCAYDLLEWQGEDIRQKPFSQRRQLLEALITSVQSPSILFSAMVDFSSWDQLHERRLLSRNNFAEGLMLKRNDSPYQAGRKRGDWWKWKVDAFRVDGVLMYAQKGHGRRADQFTDYTFGVWSNGKLVPFAKAYSGLTDKEIREVDAFIKANTFEKFGPVRTVKPDLVFEIGFEGIQESKRHKSGVAVRFPRILRWRHDKPASEADTLESLQSLIVK